MKLTLIPQFVVWHKKVTEQFLLMNLYMNPPEYSAEFCLLNCHMEQH